MEEIILQTLIKMRTDYGNNEMIIFAQDSDLKAVAEELYKAINYTRCCETFDCGNNRVNGYVKCLKQCDECKECYN